MFSTPTIACSSGAATVFATTFGLAPDHGRRHDLRILADRQLRDGNRAGDEDEGREDRREDRAVDEEV
jgi:hypothetical protein